jgi:hypothetical protein
MSLGLLGGDVDIDEFIQNKGGNTTVENGVIKMNKDGDWVLLRVLEPYTKAEFQKSVHVRKYKKKTFGGRGDKIEDKVNEDTFTLKRGEQLRISNKEGWVDEPGIFKDRYYDRNTSVVLNDAVKEVQKKDESGNVVTTTETVTSQQTGTKPGLPGLPDAGNLKWVGVGLVLVAGVVGVAYFMTKKKAAKQVATTPQQLAAPGVA